ncbi:MAG: rRNA pseudouridine synthase [Clostridia bacterium]|nr:rRNA pseudouridine synthase [Clostridia bacterium]
MMRLDKFLSNSGKGSRKDIKSILKSGAVTVNGSVVSDGSVHIDEDKDQICISGESVIYKKYIYLMLNKPQGYVSAVYDKRLPVVTGLVPDEYLHFDVFPVGRLDIDTEGLLILTNDGDLTHRVLSPKSHVNKTYFVRCALPVEDSCRDIFKEGVILDDGYKTMPAQLEKCANPNECLLTIMEGKFHQVKRMMEAVGNKVIYLKRIKMGSLPLDEALPLGGIRELTEHEVTLLLK